MGKVLDSVRRARPLLGTLVDITATGGQHDQLERAIESAFNVVEHVHRLMSYHEPDSDVSRLNRANGSTPIVVHEWTYAVLQTALEIERQSKGVFNTAVAPVLEGLGLLPQTTERSFPFDDRTPQPAVELLSGNRARLRASGSTIDLGGIAKGFAVDQAVRALRAHRARGGLVNAGGDMLGFGPDAHVVAIRDPRDPLRLMTQTRLRNAALASSGRAFEPTVSRQTSHCAIIDPGAREPVTAVRGATVRAASCTIADALTKVVMIAGRAASEVLDHYGASALFVTDSGEVLATADWQDVRPLAA